MSDDQPSSEILKQLVERLDVLERVLGLNTARLHSIEKHLEIVRQADEFPTAASSAARPATSPVKTEDLNRSPANQPASAEPPVREFPDHKWSEPEAHLPSATETAGTNAMPASPPMHSWQNEASASPTHETREAATPYPLHRPQDEKTTAGGEQKRSGPDTGGEARRAGTAANETAQGTHEKKRRDFESLVGGSWFNWIGIVAVTLGVAFFLKLAFDKQWIGPSARVSLAALVGISLLFVGERLRGRGLQSYAFILSGGGILILYLSDYAAYNFYSLIGQTSAFVLMALVTTTAVVLSVRLNALPVAILGLIGGFLTPVLLSTGVDNEVALFGYIALLDAGVLAIAYFKRWRSLDFLSFAGTVAITLGWAFKFFGPGKVWVTLFFLSVFFLLYGLLAFFHNVLPGRPTRWFDVSLAIANVSFYFGLSYLMLSEAGFDQATQALLLSVFFTWLFYATLRWSPDDRLLRYSYVGAAVTLLSMAVAIQLELHWVTIAWAVEALMLTWVGLRSGEEAARHAAIVVFCVAVGHWFVWDMTEFANGVDPSFVPLLNRRALSSVILVGAIAGAYWLYKRASEVDEQERLSVRIFFALTGNAVALTLLSLDLNDYFAARLSQSDMAQTGLHTPINNARQFSLSALWTLYATTTLALGVLRRFALLRWGGLLLLVAAICKVVIFDSAFYAASWHLPILNHTFMVYALLVAALAFSAWLYERKLSAAEPERQVIRPVLLVTANLLALAALSLEVFGYYQRLLARASSETGIFQEFREGTLFALTLVWTIYATGAFLFGAWRKARAWRWGGLLLLAFTSPLVLANLIYYDAPWHTLIINRTLVAFAVFIAALWLVVRTYARSREAFAEGSKVRPVATVAANLLALVALSAQAAGYYEAKIAREYWNWNAAENGLKRAIELNQNSPDLTLAGAAASESDFALRLRNLELAKQLSLSVVWALYGVGLLVAGRGHRLRLLRLLGLALLSLTTLKVFLWDLSSLDRAYRIISFIMLGAILLVVSYFYQRSQQPAEEK
ncbi:MAG: DUF2339 domain-containing protein [Pyrinomonadaceae bacterium]